MIETNPQFIYKYRNIYDEKKLENDNHLKALFESYIVISNRKAFNDIFDCKVDYIRPKNTYDFKQVIKSISSVNNNIHIKNYVKNGKITGSGENLINSCINNIEEMLNRYLFTCLSAKCRSNLMWSHYAKSHRGFCIEFKYDHINADAVTYQKEIPKLKIIDCLRGSTCKDTLEKISDDLWLSLRTKLDEWSYEAEYRFQANEKLNYEIIKNNNEIDDRNGVINKKFYYNHDCIESIIFGCLMPVDVRSYIINNYPYRDRVKFKEAIKKTSSIEIIDFKK